MRPTNTQLPTPIWRQHRSKGLHRTAASCAEPPVGPATCSPGASAAQQAWLGRHHTPWHSRVAVIVHVDAALCQHLVGFVGVPVEVVKVAFGEGPGHAVAAEETRGSSGGGGGAENREGQLEGSSRSLMVQSQDAPPPLCGKSRRSSRADCGRCVAIGHSQQQCMQPPSSGARQRCSPCRRLPTHRPPNACACAYVMPLHGMFTIGSTTLAVASNLVLPKEHCGKGEGGADVVGAACVANL